MGLAVRLQGPLNDFFFINSKTLRNQDWNEDISTLSISGGGQWSLSYKDALRHKGALVATKITNMWEMQGAVLSGSGLWEGPASCLPVF